MMAIIGVIVGLVVLVRIAVGLVKMAAGGQREKSPTLDAVVLVVAALAILAVLGA